MLDQRLVIVLALGATVMLACGKPPSSPAEGDSNVGDGDGEATGDGSPGDGDGSPGDGDGSPGDGDGGDGDGDVYCDVASLPQLAPIWLQPLEDRNGKPTTPGLAVAADAIFNAGYYVVDHQATDAFITRRDLDGQVQWSTDAPGYIHPSQRSLAWDGQHVYYLTSGDDAGIRRMTADGQLDESWSYESDTYLSILDFDVRSSRVLAAAHEIVVFDDPDYDDAVTIRIEKDNSSYASDIFGEMYASERATAVAPWSAGGHISAMRRDEGNTVFLRGYAGASLSMDISFDGAPAARFMHERPQGLLVAVDVYKSGVWGMWLMMVNPDGTEAWRKPLAPCGASVSTGFSSVAVMPDHLLGVVTVEVGPNRWGGLIIEMGFDGELRATHTLADAPEGTVWTETIATNGEAVAVSGASFVAQSVYTGWVARIR